MKEEDVSFGGTEAEKIEADFGELTKQVDLLRRFPSEEVASLSHNCELNRFRNALGLVPNSPLESIGTLLFGMPVYIKRWIPINEVWLQDKNGKVIKKFSI